MRPDRYQVAILSLGMVIMLATSVLLQAAEEDAQLRAEPPEPDLELREPSAMEAMLGQRLELLDRIAAESDPALATRLQHDLGVLEAQIDEMAGARDSCVSGLFWYTDFQQAVAAAEASGKPILSLRMMGNLTDEFSCANSRFFRSALYSNEEVSAYLKEHFVLHWKSVRPVPRITIDFGDGRRLHRTLTGNSIHYVLLPDGRPVDALPGLYGPGTFMRLLERARQFAVDKNVAENYEVWMPVLHLDWLNEMYMRLEADVALSLIDPLDADSEGGEAWPDALVAAELAETKSVTEIRLAAEVLNERFEEVENDLDQAQWERIALMYRGEAELDARSRDLIGERSFPDAMEAALRAVTKSRVEDPILAKIERFQSSIALDTVRNEYLLHRRIHQWYQDGEVPADLDAFNDRVYAELFLTPGDDPWIGLLPSDLYTGLDAEGVELPIRENEPPQ